MTMSTQQAGMRERMFLRKRSKRTFKLQARGQARVLKYKKDEHGNDGEFIGATPWTKNTMTAEGIDKMLRMWAGDQSGHGPLNATDASIGIDASNNPNGPFVFQQVGCDAGPTSGATTKSSPSQATLWEWHDDSTDVYANATYLHFWYKDPEGSSGDEYHVSSVNISAGLKPSDENWHYQFFMELYSTDSDFVEAGLAVLLDLYNGNQTGYLQTTGIRLRPTTGAGSGSDVGSDLTPDANPTVNTSGNTITWVWTVADGVSNGVWAGTKIKVGTSFAALLRWGGCKTDGSSCGTKANGEEWEYTYEISLTQGS